MRTTAGHDQAVREVLVPPELKEVTFTGVKNFLHARRDYERRLQDYNSKKPSATKHALKNPSPRGQRVLG